MSREHAGGVVTGACAATWAVLSALVCVALVTTAAAEAAFPGANGQIAFVSSRDGNYEIYSMDAAGAVQTNLTLNQAADLFPAWSPDGRKVAFASFRDLGNEEIYVMDADGSDPTRLTISAGADAEPIWSPDGSKIAFRSDRDGNFEIYVMNADGTGQVNVSNDPGTDDHPAWSPGGSKIAFESNRDGNFEIYTVDPDGANPADVTNDPGSDRRPAWSPYGDRIAFDSSRDGNLEIYSMSADGSGQTALSSNAADDSEPSWSPDGSKLAFRSQRDGNAEIYSMAANGTAQTRLTSNTAYDAAPDWQPSVAGFPRPKGATPFRASLVPAYQECLAPTSTHGAPLAFGSCSPPAESSPHLTIGTPDANGAGANFVGHVLLDAKLATSDLGIRVSLADIRCRTGFANCTGGVLSDYVGELGFTPVLQITDRFNGDSAAGGTEAGTTSGVAFPTAVPCVETESTSTGSTCSLTTSANSLVPGAVVGMRRTLAEVADIEVTDGGVDGDATTADNLVFARQGLFVP